MASTPPPPPHPGGGKVQEELGLGALSDLYSLQIKFVVEHAKHISADSAMRDSLCCACVCFILGPSGLIEYHAAGPRDCQPIEQSIYPAPDNPMAQGSVLVTQVLTSLLDLQYSLNSSKLLQAVQTGS